MATSPRATPARATSPRATYPRATSPRATSPRATSPRATSPRPANPAPTTVNVEVDDRATENDSTYGDELTTFTASITSSILNYRNENGRRYHAYRDGQQGYLIPNDEEEKERLDIMHEMMLTMMRRKLFLAPIDDSVARVLDIGTGTGVWAMDFADQFPHAEVWGNDLSPIQPTYVPPNVKFIVDDFEDEWAYGDLKFDFIHARYLAVSVKDFARLLRQCYENTVPGGWVEFQDWDCVLYSEDGSTDGTYIKQYYENVLPAMRKTGVEPGPGPKLEGWFRDAGFEEIHVEKFVLPIGAWPKDKRLKTLGAWNLVQAETGFEASAIAALTRHAGWAKEEVNVLVAKTLADARNPDIHGMFDFFVVYGRKPR
ncbi:hypothetical protein DTO027B9_5924 [Paecilomyces variotii]|nr:hypothetical protein DTO027B9_5924 [Paecilomyces variotii]